MEDALWEVPVEARSHAKVVKGNLPVSFLILLIRRSFAVLQSFSFVRSIFGHGGYSIFPHYVNLFYALLNKAQHFS